MDAPAASMQQVDYSDAKQQVTESITYDMPTSGSNNVIALQHPNPRDGMRHTQSPSAAKPWLDPSNSNRNPLATNFTIPTSMATNPVTAQQVMMQTVRTTIGDQTQRSENMLMQGRGINNVHGKQSMQDGAMSIQLGSGNTNAPVIGSESIASGAVNNVTITQKATGVEASRRMHHKYQPPQSNSRKSKGGSISPITQRKHVTPQKAQIAVQMFNSRNNENNYTAQSSHNDRRTSPSVMNRELPSPIKDIINDRSPGPNIPPQPQPTSARFRPHGTFHGQTQAAVLSGPSSKIGIMDEQIEHYARQSLKQLTNASFGVLSSQKNLPKDDPRLAVVSSSRLQESQAGEKNLTYFGSQTNFLNLEGSLLGSQQEYSYDQPAAKVPTGGMVGQKTRVPLHFKRQAMHYRNQTINVATGISGSVSPSVRSPQKSQLKEALKIRQHTTDLIGEKGQQTSRVTQFESTPIDQLSVLRNLQPGLTGTGPSIDKTNISYDDQIMHDLAITTRNDHRETVYKSLNDKDYYMQMRQPQKHETGVNMANREPVIKSIKELTNSTDRTKTAGERSLFGQNKMNQINNSVHTRGQFPPGTTANVEGRFGRNGNNGLYEGQFTENSVNEVQRHSPSNQRPAETEHDDSFIQQGLQIKFATDHRIPSVLRQEILAENSQDFKNIRGGTTADISVAVSQHTQITRIHQYRPPQEQESASIVSHRDPTMKTMDHSKITSQPQLVDIGSQAKLGSARNSLVPVDSPSGEFHDKEMRIKGTILVQELSRGGSGQRSRTNLDAIKAESRTEAAQFTAVAGSHLQSPLTDATMAAPMNISQTNQRLLAASSGPGGFIAQAVDEKSMADIAEYCSVKDISGKLTQVDIQPKQSVIAPSIQAKFIQKATPLDHASTKMMFKDRDSPNQSPPGTTSEPGSKTKSMAIAIDYKEPAFAKHSNIFVKESSPTRDVQKSMSPSATPDGKVASVILGGDRNEDKKLDPEEQILMHILEQILRKHHITGQVEKTQYLKYMPRQWGTIEDGLRALDPQSELPREEVDNRARNYKKDFQKQIKDHVQEIIKTGKQVKIATRAAYLEKEQKALQKQANIGIKLQQLKTTFTGNHLHDHTMAALSSAFSLGNSPVRMGEYGSTIKKLPKGHKRSAKGLQGLQTQQSLPPADRIFDDLKSQSDGERSGLLNASDAALMSEANMAVMTFEPMDEDGITSELQNEQSTVKKRKRHTQSLVPTQFKAKKLKLKDALSPSRNNSRRALPNLHFQTGVTPAGIVSGSAIVRQAANTTTDSKGNLTNRDERATANFLLPPGADQDSADDSQLLAAADDQNTATFVAQSRKSLVGQILDDLKQTQQVYTKRDYTGNGHLRTMLKLHHDSSFRPQDDPEQSRALQSVRDYHEQYNRMADVLKFGQKNATKLTRTQVEQGILIEHNERLNQIYDKLKDPTSNEVIQGRNMIIRNKHLTGMSSLKNRTTSCFGASNTHMLSGLNTSRDSLVRVQARNISPQSLATLQAPTTQVSLTNQSAVKKDSVAVKSKHRRNATTTQLSPSTHGLPSLSQQRHFAPPSSYKLGVQNHPFSHTLAQMVSQHERKRKGDEEAMHYYKKIQYENKEVKDPFHAYRVPKVREWVGRQVMLPILGKNKQQILHASEQFLNNTDIQKMMPLVNQPYNRAEERAKEAERKILMEAGAPDDFAAGVMTQPAEESVVPKQYQNVQSSVDGRQGATPRKNKRHEKQLTALQQAQKNMMERQRRDEANLVRQMVKIAQLVPDQ